MPNTRTRTKESIHAEVLRKYVANFTAAMDNICGHGSEMEQMVADFSWVEKDLRKALLGLFFEISYGEVRIRRNTTLDKKIERSAEILAEGIALHFLTEEMVESVCAEVLSKKTWTAAIRKSYKDKLEEAIATHFDKLLEQQAEREGAEIADVMLKRVMTDMKMPTAAVVLEDLRKKSSKKENEK